MKVLILSCSTGQGHNSAAKAVYEAMGAEDIECEFKDAFSIVGNKAPQRASDIYSTVAGKAPLVFGGAYHVASFISNTKVKSPVYAVNMLWADKVERYISDNKFDVVITSHLFVAQVLTHLIRKGRLKLLTVAIATDYTSIPFWEETELNYYIIPHKELTGEFAKRGLPEKKLIPIGIPVSNQYKRVYTKEDARKLLGMPANIYTILIMTGSMGYGNIRPLVDEIMLQFENQIRVIVLTGNNKDVRTKLNKIYQNDKRIEVLEFTPNAGLYMDAADLLFTKPGGLSTTEAAIKNIPLILTNQIPGCESKNIKFFINHDMAYYSSNTKEQVGYARQLKENPAIAEKMMSAQKKIINPDAASDICKFVVSRYTKQHTI